MTGLPFQPNAWPTLGVEIELQLLDAKSLDLKSCVTDFLARIPPELIGFVKHELMQCQIEVISGVCRTVSAVEQDLSAKLRIVQAIAQQVGATLFWSATHPFARWFEQQIMPDDRYYRLVDNLQETARRLLTFGLHVHVGLDSGDKAIMICDRLLRHLPTLLALSANSPFWSGRATGLHSHRSKVLENLPTAGLPPLMRNWSEFVWLVNHLIETEFISSIREIWWDVRPHHAFGTIEIRICDMPPTLDDVLGITALIQCLVHSLSKEIDIGTYQHDCHPMMVHQNKWRACRYGRLARLVDPYTQHLSSASEVTCRLVDKLEPTAAELGCERYLASVRDMAHRETGAERQLATFERTRELHAVVRDLAAKSVVE